MNLNIESDTVELIDSEFFFSGTGVLVHQVLSDIANGLSISEVAEEYDLEESSIVQFLQDVSETFR